MKQKKYYCYLVLVIMIWGIAPMMSVIFYQYLSAALYSAIAAWISAISFTILGWKKRKELNRRRIAVAALTGVAYSLATVLQMIGLQYTTPSMFAFLENTSCIVVPILAYLMVRRRSHPLVIVSSILCLAGCFVLTGTGLEGEPGVGELLCALAGVFFSFNMVGTSEYAKGIPIVLYLMVQKWVHTVTSTSIMVFLHLTKVNGRALEEITFIWNPWAFLLVLLHVLLSGTLCWILRTQAVLHIDVTVVAVAMPLSAVITMILSVLVGTDSLTMNLLIGAGMILAASVLSGIGSERGRRKEKQNASDGQGGIQGA